jgi:hypothetical protein
MNRACGVAWVVVAAIATTTRAAASPGAWTVTAEAGGEVDTNVERVETGPGLDTSPITSPVVQFGARVDGRSRVLGGDYVVSVSDLTRVFTEDDASIENVTLFAVNARWLHPLDNGPVSLGVAATAADALPLSDPVGDRTFSNVGGDLLLAARGNDQARFLLALGGRSFVYKPDQSYDWSGPTASARLDLTLWQPEPRTRSLELAFTAGFESRTFYNLSLSEPVYALANVCPAGAAPSVSCSAPTSLQRVDRFQRVGAELTWVGKQAASLGYELVVIDSNSFGESFVRHRASASVTFGLPFRLYATALAILYIDRYLDGLIIPKDPNQQDFTNIEDENYSSLQVRLARQLTKEWSVEARAAIWRDIDSQTMDLEYHRELVTLGVVYTH